MANKLKIEYSATTLGGIIDRIKNGEIKIPPFQRTFDWSGKDMARFFNSVTNGEPFGSIMLWNDNTNSTKIKQTNTYFNSLSKGVSSETSKTYLIDGQQRSTTFILLYLLHNNDTFKAKHLTKATSLYFDVSDKIFYSGKKRESSILAHNFFEEDFKKMWKTISNTVDVEKIAEEQDIDGNDLYGDIKDVYESFNNVSLGKTEVFSSDLDEVIQIFTLINTKGKKLSPFNIVHAYYISAKFDLDSLFTKIIKNFKEHWGEFTKPQLLLLGYSAMHKTISNSDILNMCTKVNGVSSKEIEYFKNKFEKDLESIVDIAKNHLYFPKLDFVSSGNILNVLIRVFQEKNELYEADYLILRNWVKLAIINERYVSGSEGIKSVGYSNDVDLVTDAIAKNMNISNVKGEIKWIKNKEFDAKSIKYENYGSGSATYKYAISMIIKFLPSIASGGFVTKESFSKINDLNIHHIFPKGNIKFKEYEYINSISNLTPLEQKPNIKINNESPHIYLTKLLKDGKVSEKNVGNALINLNHLEEIDKFIDERSEKISKMLNDII